MLTTQIHFCFLKKKDESYFLLYLALEPIMPFLKVHVFSYISPLVILSTIFKIVIFYLFLTVIINYYQFFNSFILKDESTRVA